MVEKNRTVSIATAKVRNWTHPIFLISF